MFTTRRDALSKSVRLVLNFKFLVSSRELLVLPFDYNLHLDWLPEAVSLTKGDGAESCADLTESNGIYIKAISSVIDKHEQHPFRVIF